MLNKFIQVLEGLTVYPDNMLLNLAKTRGLIFSQRVLLAMMDKGLPRMKAYDMVQRCAMRTWKETCQFKQALLDDKEVSGYLTPQDLDEIFDLDCYLRNIDKIYKRLGL